MPTPPRRRCNGARCSISRPARSPTSIAPSCRSAASTAPTRPACMCVPRPRRASAPTASSPSTTTSASAAPIATSPAPIRPASRSPRRTSPMARTRCRTRSSARISARLGVAQKCTFCSDRIDFGIENGLTPGSDPRATPACVNACIADALHFGDLDDAEQQRLPTAAQPQEFPHACRARHRAGLLLSLRQGGRRAGGGYPARARGRASRAHSHPRGRALASETLGLEGRPAISCAAAPAPDCSALRRSPASTARDPACRALLRSRSLPAA